MKKASPLVAWTTAFAALSTSVSAQDVAGTQQRPAAVQEDNIIPSNICVAAAAEKQGYELESGIDPNQTVFAWRKLPDGGRERLVYDNYDETGPKQLAGTLKFWLEGMTLDGDDEIVASVAQTSRGEDSPESNPGNDVEQQKSLRYNVLRVYFDAKHNCGLVS